MNATKGTRGQPLWAFAVVLGIWLVARVVLWEPPFALRASPSTSLFAGKRPAWTGFTQEAGPGAAPSASPEPLELRRTPVLVEPTNRLAVPAGLDAIPLQRWRTTVTVPLAIDGVERVHPRDVAGPQMLLAAESADLASPPDIPRRYPASHDRAREVRLAAAERPLLGVVPAAPDRRISADAWLVWRDEASGTVAPGSPAYGRSQAGAVLRYRFAGDSPIEPALHARATHSLVGSRQGEAAAGLSVRPIPGVPISFAAEGRVTESAAGRELRAAAFAVAGLPPAELLAGMRGEAYVQAGWVSGREATAFIDGQARIDRHVVRLGDGELRAGLGAWGGAQRGAARLDVGPSATLGFKIGRTHTRVAIDYRLRAAGDAAPASGPAVTFSAGF